MIKQETIQRKIEWINDMLDRMELGRYTGGVTISQISDKISWLHRFGHIDDAQLTQLVDRFCEVCQSTLLRNSAKR